MRIAVINFPAGDSGKLLVIARGLARGFEGAGHRVEILEADADPSRLGGYDFVAVGTESRGAGGKLPGRVADFLGQSFGIQGKRSLAFVRKSGLRPSRLLDRLMAAMEKEGMRVVDSEVLVRVEDAAAAGRNAPVERIQARG